MSGVLHLPFKGMRLIPFIDLDSDTNLQSI